MSRYFQAIARGTAVMSMAALLAGCNLASLAKVGGGGSRPNLLDLDGDGQASAGEQALGAHAKTYAGPGGVANIAAAQAAGIQGIATGTGGAFSAGANTSNVKVADIKVSPDMSTLTLTVDGQTYTLESQGQPTSQSYNGRSYTQYTYQASVPNPNGDPFTNQVTLINGDYSSLGLFLKNGWPFGYGGYAAMVSGALTPASGLPTQSASYSGAWMLVVDNGQEIGGLKVTGSNTTGTFSANANFDTKALSMQLKDSSGSEAGSGAGKISGNQFAGSVSINTTVMTPGQLNVDAQGVVHADPATSGTYQGTSAIAGEFYGPNAEEIGGIIYGEGSVNGAAPMGSSAAFLGAKVP